MRSIEDFGLVDGRIDDALVFWRLGDRRRAVITRDYTASARYLSRLLRHFGVTSGVSAETVVLREAGEVMPVTLRQHSMGLMRPYLYGRPMEIRRVDQPVLICQELHGRHGVPILVASRSDAERIVREIEDDRGIDRLTWQSYECEVMRTVYEKLMLDLLEWGHLTRFRTRLEAELVDALATERITGTA
jgi:hypothetical protein